MEIKMVKGGSAEAIKLFEYGADKTLTGAIIADDGCYVVCVPSAHDSKRYLWSTHIFAEAFEALCELPPIPSA